MGTALRILSNPLKIISLGLWWYVSRIRILLYWFELIQMSPVPVWSEDHENTYQMDRNEDAEADKCMGDFILIIARILHIPVLQEVGRMTMDTILGWISVRRHLPLGDLTHLSSSSRLLRRPIVACQRIVLAHETGASVCIRNRERAWIRTRPRLWKAATQPATKTTPKASKSRPLCTYSLALSSSIFLSLI